MITVKDQLNREVVLRAPAQRIVSLVPSQTELLHYFNLEKEVVGLTKFCIHPNEWFQSKARVGGTKNVDFDQIKALSPDLIIANKEENTKEDIERLARDYTIYISDVVTFEDAYDMIESVGRLCGKEQQAVDLIDNIQESFEGFQPSSKKVIYLIWKDPMMCVGTDNFIHTVMETAGYSNVVTKPRYTEISTEEIKQLNPDEILLSTEPFPFKEEHLQEIEKTTGVKCRIVDGEMFSWYGSRILGLRKYLDKIR